MLSIDALKQAGYKYYINPPNGGRLADALYQKAIMRNGKILFHINVYHYDRRNFGPNPKDPDGFETEVHFMSGNMGFDVVLYHGPDTDVPFIEQWFTNMFDSMGCSAYGDH